MSPNATTWTESWVERNAGEYDHSRMLGAVLSYLHARRLQWSISVFPILRVLVSPTRIRVPDVCAFTSEPTEQVPSTPPFICIEILSPEDRLSAMHQRVQDYLNFDVPYVWILDPATRKAYRSTPNALTEISELQTDNPEITVPLTALFE
ncbi:MAG TPA: Uma2 family endonuclease [Bryobacteraceae bacterium]|nr:Uma2 family endonuclease [Bryobacteraceae bacterium]